jgi:serine/threonine protein phosphatase PrpC
MGIARESDSARHDGDAVPDPAPGPASVPVPTVPADAPGAPEPCESGIAPVVQPESPGEPVPEAALALPSSTAGAPSLATPPSPDETEGPAGLSEDDPTATMVSPGRVAETTAPPPDEDQAVSGDNIGIETGHHPGEALAAGDDLEEIVLPSAIQAPAPLSAGTELGPGGGVRIEQFLDTRGRLNRYHAVVRGADGVLVAAELRETPAEHPDLRRESEVLGEVRYAMLPRPLAAFEQDGRRYLAVERLDMHGTLAEALEAGLDPARVISIALQLTQVLRRLHAGGWSLLGLQPSHVALGDPLRITRLGTAARIGEGVEDALSVVGYSAPEVAHRALVTGKEDVYTLGALLYRVLVGVPVPEQGPELAALGALVRLPGAPQLLDAALAPVEERVDLETFYRRLLAFKAQMSRRVLALELAGGTTVGLNRTRPVNEDAYASTAWSLAYHERVTFRALLCVVDGMGGMEAGEVASRAAVRAVLDGVGGDSGYDATAPEPVTLVRAAARAVYDAAQGRAVGATITCAVVDDGVVTLAHVGDTRAYLLRGGTLSQLTHDHSLVAAMVSSGVLTPEEARGHPDSNKVLRSLGGQRELEDAYIDTLAAAHGSETLSLQEGDFLLLCSDGVWGVLDDDALRGSVLGEESCMAVVRTVLRRVLDGGAPDNATLIVARCTEMPAN